MKEGGDIMFKQSIRFLIIYFVVLTVGQFLANKEINWTDNIMIGFFTFLFFLLFKWAETPYKWNKDK